MDVYKEWLGIPEGPRPPDHYALLRCVQFEDDPEKIRKNYRKLNGVVRKYATGQYSVQSQELLNELARAMLCLTDAELKRDYDRGLGREFDGEEEAGKRKSLGEILRDQGKITNEQLKEAASFADARGLEMRDAVVQMRLVDADVAGQAYAAELGLSYVDLSEMLPDDAILDLFPRSMVRRHGILPLFVEGDRLLVACTHEPTADLEEEVRLRSGHPMRPVVATPLSINQGLSKYYAPGMREQVEGNGAGSVKGKGKAPGKAIFTTTASEPARAKMSQLSSGEKAHRKQMGILFMCWATIGSVVVDNFVLRPLVFPKWAALIAVTLVVPPIVAGWVVKSYWK